MNFEEMTRMKMSNSEAHNQNYFGVSLEHLDKLTGRCARSRLDELKDIVNDKYRDARLYTVWKSMKKRCENPNCKSYKWYGAKGVSVCSEWHDYNIFREWAYANGYNQSANYGECTIDRIDPCGNYEPSNCRWVTMAEQAKNKRVSA